MVVFSVTGDQACAPPAPVPTLRTDQGTAVQSVRAASL